MSVNAVNLIREIRDRNYEETHPLNFEERLALIHRKAAEVDKKVKSLVNDLVEEK